MIAVYEKYNWWALYVFFIFFFFSFFNFYGKVNYKNHNYALKKFKDLSLSSKHLCVDITENKDWENIKKSSDILLEVLSLNFRTRSSCCLFKSKQASNSRLSLFLINCSINCDKTISLMTNYSTYYITILFRISYSIVSVQPIFIVEHNVFEIKGRNQW